MSWSILVEYWPFMLWALTIPVQVFGVIWMHRKAEERRMRAAGGPGALGRDLRAARHGAAAAAREEE